MFCPQCGSTQSDELKYCKTCGANLQALRQVMATRGEDDKIDWNKTWVAEMFTTHAEIDRRRGVTPEMKRRREIKAGLITASAGIGVTVFLFALFGGLIASGRLSEVAIAVLSRIWLVGLIPVLIGAVLVFMGTFVRQPDEGEPMNETGTETKELGQGQAGGYLPPADTNELEPGIPFSVTDSTTRHLKEKVPNSRS